MDRDCSKCDLVWWYHQLQHFGYQSLIYIEQWRIRELVWSLKLWINFLHFSSNWSGKKILMNKIMNKQSYLPILQFWGNKILTLNVTLKGWCLKSSSRLILSKLAFDWRLWRFLMTGSSSFSSISFSDSSVFSICCSTFVRCIL